MRLEGQRKRGGKHLNKVGKLASELAGDVRAQDRFGILLDEVSQRAGADPRRQVGVRSHPELGVRDGVAVLASEESGNEPGVAPRIMLDSGLEGD
jgi:hypothetical protein